MVSKNLSVCLSVTNFDLNYLRTGKIASSLMRSKMKTIKKKFACLGAAAVSVSPFLPQKQPFLEFLPGNNYPDSHHSQGVSNLPHKFHLYLIIPFNRINPRAPILSSTPSISGQQLDFFFFVVVFIVCPLNHF